jgi:hypothetical protein
MSNNENSPASGWRPAARVGAGIGVKMTLLYAAIFILYAVVRSTLALLAWPSPDAGTAGTVLATASSLTIAAISVTLLVLPISALAGLVASLLVYWLQPRTESQQTPAKRPIARFAVAALTALIVQAILLPAVGLHLYTYQAETYIFWFGLPALLYVGAIGFGEWRREERFLSRGSLP